MTQIHRLKSQLSVRIAFVFIVVISTSSMVNFDSGGTAAVLVRLSWGCEDANMRPPEKEYDPSYPCLDQVWKGYLGSVPYVGLVFGCPLVGVLMAKFREKPVLCAFIGLNAAATFLFAFQTNKYYLVAAKFMIGFTQAAPSIYGPVWVASFAPSSVRTLWFGLMQSAAAIGNLVGYAVCGYMVSAGVYYQWGFRFQAICLLIACAIIRMTPSSKLNTGDSGESSAAYEHVPSHSRSCESIDSTSVEDEESARLELDSKQRTRTMVLGSSIAPSTITASEDAPECRPRFRKRDKVLAPLKLLKYPMYASQLFTQCALFFVVTAIQQWASEFFTTEFRRNKTEVTTVFVIVSATAPILGVVIGSSVIDSIGTETGAQVADACRMTFYWGATATLAGFTAGAIDPDPLSEQHNLRFWGVVCALWLQLFFGGAMLPASSAMGLRAIPPSRRSTASTLSQLLCNIFGFALGSLVPGLVSDQYGMRRGMQVAFAWASFGCIGALASWYVAERESARSMQPESGQDEPSDSESDPSSHE
eukprot:TRINITY_DN15366_c1_g1_i2.p1 TRINITY_DN15366_c1_g1~~TRINITY_DN15366_c1_g1_i2.p1  ORF type:complete len:532 (-),score=34.70 TRINITY_DN15366_c1_g1_i2:53-1648(-)